METLPLLHGLVPVFFGVLRLMKGVTATKSINSH